MPKIIVNLRKKLLEEAKRQVFENGYASLTIRSVASACNVGVGTVYNYFKSKEMLVASFMLDDWQICLNHIHASCHEESELEDALQCIDVELSFFKEKYQSLFKDENASKSYEGGSGLRHNLLRDQIAKPLEKVCLKYINENVEFIALFLAENLLKWSLSEYPFEIYKDLLIKIVKQ